MEIFISVAELETSPTHSLQHLYGAMPISIVQGPKKKLECLVPNLLNILSNLNIMLTFVLKTNFSIRQPIEGRTLFPRLKVLKLIYLPPV